MTTLRAIVEVVLAPLTIVAVLAFIMRAFFNKWLSKDVEGYKSQLQTELESHKARLKAEFDARYFEFQTRFSLLHQRRTIAITDLYALLSETETKFAIVLSYFETLGNPLIDSEKNLLMTGKSIKEHIEEADTKCLAFDDYFRRNRILFDENICHASQELVNLMVPFISRTLDLLDLEKTKGSNFASTIRSHWNQESRKNLENLRALEGILRNRFRDLLSAEASIQQTEKTALGSE